MTLLEQILQECANDEELKGIYQHLDQSLDLPSAETQAIMVLIVELKQRMKQEVTQFTFRKKDGEIRTAFGTRDNQIITRHEGPRQPSKQNKTSNNDTFPYFDIEKKAWRCFKVESLMDINRKYTI